MTKRYNEIIKVLALTLILNLAVSIIKLIFGIIFNIGALIADGIHSLTDTFTNIVGIIAINFAKKRNDKKHPYGYEKYETIATLFIAGLIAFLGYQTLLIGIRDFGKMTIADKPNIIIYLSIIVTMIFNLLTVVYEGGNGKLLKSEFLIADSNETKSDLLVSASVLISLFLASIFPILRLNSIITIVISLIIFKNSFTIFKETIDVLTDSNVTESSIIEQIVLSHPDVKFCHAVRTRGKKDAIFVDFHMGVDDKTNIELAHNKISHEVKIMLKEKIEGIKSVFIHIEPESAANRTKSVFRESDY